MSPPGWRPRPPCSSSTTAPQFLANRDAGNFDDYPDPTATLGEALIAETPRPSGRVVVSHLGVGLADVIFGGAILRRRRADRARDAPAAMNAGTAPR